MGRPAPRRRDYSEIVTFPVEIVGRDGEVRRLGFAESVSVYERRARLAGERMQDPEEVAAEQSHCRRRIRQLRTNYLREYGWPIPWQGDDPARDEPEMAAHLVDLLRRTLPVRTSWRPCFTRLQGDEPSHGVPRPRWHLRVAGDVDLLLYVVPSESDAHRRLLRVLGAHPRAGGESEVLLGQTRCDDQALVLTAPAFYAEGGGVLARLGSPADEEERAGTGAQRDLERAADREDDEALHRWALARSSRGLRSAQVLVLQALLAWRSGDPSEAEAACFLALDRPRPDPRALWLRGLARERRGAIDAASRDFDALGAQPGWERTGRAARRWLEMAHPAWAARRGRLGHLVAEAFLTRPQVMGSLVGLLSVVGGLASGRVWGWGVAAAVLWLGVWRWHQKRQAWRAQIEPDVRAWFGSG